MVTLRFKSAFVLFVLLQIAGAQKSKPSNKWDPLKQLLDGWEFTTEYAVSVGDASGELFRYQGGNFTMKTLVPTGSTSKWPSAMMFAGLADDGTVALDEPVSKYLSWWTSNSSDLRSLVTLRTLLSFTSGFGGGHPGEEFNTRAAREWRRNNNVSASLSLQRNSLPSRLVGEIGPEAAAACDESHGDITACAKSIYNGVKLIGKPGTVYSYNSNHLQLAAALAVAASGLSIENVIQKYLIQPFGMTSSHYAGKCPDMAANLITTGEDYQKFLHGILTYKPLSRSIVTASEKDYTPFMSSYYTLYGDYGFGHFLMCFDSVDGFTAECKEKHCHMDPGAFGFIPILDRKHSYYMQVVAAEYPPTGSYPLSGIPEYLAVAIKPHIDAIMSSNPPDPEEHLHYTPRFMTLGVADVNYCLDCKLHPENCQ